MLLMQNADNTKIKQMREQLECEMQLWYDSTDGLLGSSYKVMTWFMICNDSIFIWVLTHKLFLMEIYNQHCRIHHKFN